MVETVYELSSICESVYTGKKVISEADEKKDEEKEDSGNPFADTKDADTTDSSDDSGSDDTDDTQSTEDDTTDDQESDEGTESPFGSDDDTGDADEESDDDFGGESDTIGTGESVQSEEYSDVMNFGITILMLATQVHFWHINCNTGFEHQTLEELYYALNNVGDKLLENIVSVTKTSVLAGNELSFDFGNLEYDKEESISILEDIRSEADSLVSNFSDNQGLCSILSEVSEKVGTAIYKLTKLSA